METGLGRPSSHLGSGKRVYHAVKQGKKITCLLPRTGLNQPQKGFKGTRDSAALLCPSQFITRSSTACPRRCPSTAWQPIFPKAAPPQPPPLFSEQHCPNARPLARDSTRQPAKHLADRGHGSLPTRLLLHKYALNIQLEFIHREQQLRR